MFVCDEHKMAEKESPLPLHWNAASIRKRIFPTPAFNLLPKQLPIRLTVTHGFSEYICYWMLSFIIKARSTFFFFNVLPNDNFVFYSTKFKAFVDDRFVVFDREQIQNVMGKEENAGFQHFLLFPFCFQKFFALGRKIQDCVVKS